MTRLALIRNSPTTNSDGQYCGVLCMSMKANVESKVAQSGMMLLMARLSTRRSIISSVTGAKTTVETAAHSQYNSPESLPACETSCSGILMPSLIKSVSLK